MKVSTRRTHTFVSRFCVRGTAYQYKVSLCLHEVMEAALVPSRIKAIRILNYLNDWLILVLQNISHLGLQVNRKKSTLSLVQRTFFFGMELDSLLNQACSVDVELLEFIQR